MTSTKKSILGLLLVVLSHFTVQAQIGLMGAMDKEIVLLKSKIENLDSTQIGGQQFYSGTLSGQEVILCKSGIGKAQAAMTTTLLATTFKVTQIWFTGIAGAAKPDLEVLDIVIGNAFFQHDFDTHTFDGKVGLAPGADENGFFYPSMGLQQMAFEAAVKAFGTEKVHEGLIVTGDQFIDDPQKIRMLFETYGASAVEMEGAAVAQIAQNFQIPYVIIRSISDKADGNATQTYQEIARKAAKISETVILNMILEIN
ncbi:5'-methylthioadenosine/adenosylhomocysteine nucleosidase [Persicobacter diffluens]|uniref:adenosylhomocysteine nucleosidase n=1 Tax=Persicobacter diffluens TaxID=981 RepID=A0AAN4W0H5_9BACT|nr:5'-methylthioadenosine/S-adenosylhomocysteine nucleosidase [Persicobacter diffluens]